MEIDEQIVKAVLDAIGADEVPMFAIERAEKAVREILAPHVKTKQDEEKLATFPKMLQMLLDWSKVVDMHRYGLEDDEVKFLVECEQIDKPFQLDVIEKGE